MLGAEPSLDVFWPKLSVVGRTLGEHLFTVRDNRLWCAGCQRVLPEFETSAGHVMAAMKQRVDRLKADQPAPSRPVVSGVPESTIVWGES